jgi:hypothetical protein
MIKYEIYSFSLQRLSGVFEVRIYPSEYTIPNIMTACKESSEAEYTWPSKVIDGIDISKLEKIVGGIDYASIRKRRAIYSRLYHEASISHQQGRGISFTDMLLLLAHHKLIVDREALVFVSHLCIDNNSLTSLLQLEGSCCPNRNQQTCHRSCQFGSCQVPPKNDLASPTVLSSQRTRAVRATRSAHHTTLLNNIINNLEF